MFVLPIPNRRDGNERWRDSALRKAKHEPHCCKARKALRCCQAHTDRSPDDAATRISEWSSGLLGVAVLHCNPDKLRQREP